jgi:hypothetical protein
LTGLRRLAAATALLAALAACSSAVSGQGSFEGAGPSGTATPTASDSPTPTATPTPTARTVLSCTGGTVLQPKNAPYCYLMPSAFKDVSALTSTTVGQTGEHPSAVARASETITQTVRDLIIVLDFTLRLDTDALSDEELVQQLSTLITQFETQGFVFDSRVPGRASVDGARGFTYHAKAREGYFSDILFAFRGKQEVEVNCQYKAHQADIQRACGAILDSLQIAHPG